MRGGGGCFFVRRRGAYTYNTDKQAKGDRDFEKN
jgi:hypothetical protein